MSQNCPKCQAANPNGARFCQNCGATLAATVVQGRTVVAPMVPGPNITPPPPVPMPPSPAPPCPPANPARPFPTSVANQREHIAFAVDKSTSMTEPYDSRFSKMDAAIRANSSMVLHKAQIDPYDEIGIVAFEDFAIPVLPLCPIQTRKRDILQALQSLTPGGGTDINEGLEAARDMFDWNRNDVVRRIVLLTDGHGGYPLKTATDLKSRGVVIDVIGVGDSPANVDEKLLKKVASVVQGELRYRFIKDQQTLVAHYTQLANKTATA
jgi:Mg-chelatase subunit ChlD